MFEVCVAWLQITLLWFFSQYETFIIELLNSTVYRAVLWYGDCLMIPLLANAPFISLFFFSLEILHFDSGSLGLQQWNQRWVFVHVWHLHLAPPPHTTKAISGRSRVFESQKRKFILPELPALFNMVHWVCMCVCLKRVCWQVPVRQGSEWEEAERGEWVGMGVQLREGSVAI